MTYSGSHPYIKGKYITPLSIWCQEHSISPWKFAILMGCHHERVYAWYNGNVLPTLFYAQRIEEATNGGVPITSWLGTELCQWQYKNVGRINPDELVRRTEGYVSLSKERAKIRRQVENAGRINDIIRKQSE